MTEPLFDTIVCLSFTEWAGLPHNSRHLMSEAARRGYRVLWVDPLGLRSVRFQRSDIDKLRRRAHELRHPLIEVDDGIWRLAPAGVPFQDTRVGAALNRRLLSVQIKAALRRLKAKRTLLWVYSPQQVSLCNKLDCDLTLYYRTDAYPAAPGVHAARVEQLEAEAARLADLCIATNERSISDLPRGTRRSLLVRNGIDLRVFDAESEYEDPIPEVGRPRLLVIGTFDHWMNTDLLYTLMREHPDWSLVLAGDCKTPIDRLTALDNVTYLGRLSFAELPALVSNCDIGLVPFRVDPFTTRGSPGKIYQYLAMGLPVLCTPFLEARAYSEQLAVAPEEPAAFAAALAEMLRSDSPALARARREFAAKQAWVDRFDSIENELRLIREQSSVKRVVLHAVGARPNFVKMAPVIAALGRIPGIEQRVVHTGQHYDRELSDRIADDLDFPKPDYLLGIGSGTHAEQIGRTMVAFERVLIELKPDLVVVGGDVNATLACALTAARLAIPVAHVEAGLRSGDWTMPEEMNRVLTDRVSDFLFTHSPEARANLLGEGIAAESICDVGNTMIDSLRRLEPFARARRTWERVGVEPGGYILVTLHRPSNVDDPERFSAIADELVRLSERAPVIFPVHPRTRQRLRAELNKLEQADIRLLEPLGYLDFLSLESEAGAIVTDSGGVQEEASAFGVACFTLRPNTERPITIVSGTNTLLGDDPSELRRVSLQPKSGRSIPLWDGHAGERVAEVLAKALLGESAPRFEQLSAGLAVPGEQAAGLDGRQKVSIIVTVKNESESIERFMASLLFQSRTPDEIVISDGGSGDGTLEKLERLAEHDRNVVVISAPGSNIARGRNMAIERAKGPIIAVTDAGTTVLPNWLEKLVEPFEQYPGLAVSSGFFIAGGRRWFERSLSTVITPQLKEIRPRDFLPSSRSVAFEKKWWTHVGGYPEWLTHCEDIIFDLDLESEGARFDFAPEALVVWHARSNLARFFRQYYYYARGDGRSGLWPLRHTIRYSAYTLGVVLLALGYLWPPAFAIVAGLACIHLSKFALRLVRRPVSKNRLSQLGSLLLMPLIVVTGDVAKMVGYPVGVCQRLAAWRRKSN